MEYLKVAIPRSGLSLIINIIAQYKNPPPNTSAPNNYIQPHMPTSQGNTVTGISTMV